MIKPEVYSRFFEACSPIAIWCMVVFTCQIAMGEHGNAPSTKAVMSAKQVSFQTTLNPVFRRVVV